MTDSHAGHRCAWAASDPPMRAYHDAEWGVSEHDPRMLWETLMLQGFQAGLAWITVLRYAWVQAVGIVNDHAIGCFRRDESVRSTTS